MTDKAEKMAAGSDAGGVNARRRNFLRGRFSMPPQVPSVPPLRPPWARAEAEFLRLCTRCGDCVRACPTGIIVGAADASDASPKVDFSRGECTFCGDCRRVCPSGALQPAADAGGNGAPLPWTLRADIGVSCLGHQRVECRVCEDQCGVAAIRIRPRIGGAGIPEVDFERCNGCGACVAPCPVGAIAVGAIDIRAA